jgi:transglutaminase-like putative cysteine protease
MQYKIQHQTKYKYSRSLLLKPHLIRLRPQSNSWQKLQSFQIEIDPKPIGFSEFIDLDGNDLIRVWFDRETDFLSIDTCLEVDTLVDNPFNYLLESWMENFPVDYPNSLSKQLHPYLNLESQFVDPIIIDLVRSLREECDDNIVSFLFNLNQVIYRNCQYIVRESGQPWDGATTWRKQQGSCRDFAVLFIEVCRLVGLAARFVSGYQAGDPDNPEKHLHAWVEVYLAGAGWRGYDPSHGLVVTDSYIVLAASAIPRHTVPISGDFVPLPTQSKEVLPLRSQMEYKLLIEAGEDDRSKYL